MGDRILTLPVLAIYILISTVNKCKLFVCEYYSFIKIHLANKILVTFMSVLYKKLPFFFLSVLNELVSNKLVQRYPKRLAPLF